MNKTNNPEFKSQINSRLARIEGQLRGVQKMVDEDRDCRDILQQLIAIRSAVQSASLSFLQNAAIYCLLNLEENNNPAAQRSLMNDLIRMMGKVS
jgi:DNA-binding FrmR family transcriptional regulator